MNTEYTLQATKRDNKGTSSSKKIRKNNGIPAVVYGDKNNNNIILDANEVAKQIKDSGVYSNVIQLKIDKKTVLSHINNGFSNEENESIVYGSSGKRIYAKTSNQKKIVDLHEKNDLLFVIGPAGTGKTYVSVALGVKALKEKKIKKIIITRPVVEAGENLGFLPGDLQDKIDPYLKPIYDALEDMIPVQKMKKFIENKTIEIAPLAYMRGRTLNNSFIIVDESQNTTKEQMKMVLTRMGFGSYLVINGDLTQIDLPKNIDSGLSNAVKVLKDTDGIGFTRFLSRDVVRHPLVRKIIDAYEYFEEKVKTK